MTRTTCSSVALVFALIITTAVHGDILNVPADQPTIQAGIDAASNGDEVVVAPGTYAEVIDFSGKAITLRSSDGANVTIIDGTGLSNSVVKCVSGEESDTVLDGFTITGGTGDPSVGTLGGGLLNDGSSPTILNCVFVENTVEASGGGMANLNHSSPTVRNCRFISNHAPNGSGGGMINGSFSNPLVTNCTFDSNTTKDFGGGINSSAAADPILINCIFVGNIAGAGGGMTNFDNNPIIVNCTFRANDAIGGGCCGCGGECADVARGGGLFDRGGETNQVVTNCIFWNNSDGSGSDESAQIHLTSGTASVNYSVVQGWTGDLGGIGNIGDDPLFVDPDNSDAHISIDSPAIEAGDNSVVEDDAVDMDGEPRIQHGVVDMGADEFNFCPSDFDFDGQVGATDLAMLLGAWGPCPEPPEPCPADLQGTGDGLVGPGDLAVLLGSWGPCE